MLSQSFSQEESLELSQSIVVPRCHVEMELSQSVVLPRQPVLASPIEMSSEEPPVLVKEWQEALIEAVRCRPVLFDKTHKDYKDARGIKKNNWLDVAKEVTEATGDVLTGKYSFEVFTRLCCP